MVDKYQEDLMILKNRLLSKDLVTVNLEGNFDGKGKQYMVDLFKKGMPVIPSYDNPDDVKDSYLEYIIKLPVSYSSFGQITVSKDELKNHFKDGLIIQPKIDFISEVQFYYVGNDFQYALSYTPCKYPLYPKPIKYIPTEEELDNANMFANLSGLKVGVQRIDFLRKPDGKLILLEVEDTSPNLSLYELDIETKNLFLNNYKLNIYNYLKERD